MPLYKYACYYDIVISNVLLERVCFSLANIPCDTEQCPARIVQDLIAGKWKLDILWQLHRNTCRFGELQKRMPEVTRGVLTQQLRELERHGLVYREVYKEVPPKVEYSLTDIGRSFMPIFKVLGEWGKSYVNRAGERGLEKPDASGSGP